MRLVTHAAGQGNLAQIGRSGEHETLRELDASARNVEVRRNAERDPEGPGEMAVTQTQVRCQVLDTNARAEIGVNMGADPPPLPPGEAMVDSGRR